MTAVGVGKARPTSWFDKLTMRSLDDLSVALILSLSKDEGVAPMREQHND
jgi:hypothetical protein